MESLSRNDAEQWCVAHGVTLRPGERLRPSEPEFARSFPIPSDTGQRLAMVATQFAPFADQHELLVWFTDWGVWPSSERRHIFDRFRLSYGEARPLIEIPAHVFTASEAEDALSFVSLGALFMWDVFVIAGDGHSLLHYSHDEGGWAAGEAWDLAAGCPTTATSDGVSSS